MSDTLLSLFKKERPWADQFRRSLIKSDREGIALVALYKRVTVSESLSISLKKSGVSDSLVIRANHSQKRAIRLKKNYFSNVFDSFPPLYAKRANLSHCSLLSRSFLKRDGIDFLSSLFTKETPWANWSRRSLKQRDWSVSLFFTSESLFWSQKTSDSLEQPVIEFPTLSVCSVYSYTVHCC